MAPYRPATGARCRLVTPSNLDCSLEMRPWHEGGEAKQVDRSARGVANLVGARAPYEVIRSLVRGGHSGAPRHISIGVGAAVDRPRSAAVRPCDLDLRGELAPTRAVIDDSVGSANEGDFAAVGRPGEVIEEKPVGPGKSAHLPSAGGDDVEPAFGIREGELMTIGRPFRLVAAAAK